MFKNKISLLAISMLLLDSCKLLPRDSSKTHDAGNTHANAAANNRLSPFPLFLLSESVTFAQAKSGCEAVGMELPKESGANYILSIIGAAAETSTFWLAPFEEIWDAASLQKQADYRVRMGKYIFGNEPKPEPIQIDEKYYRAAYRSGFFEDQKLTVTNVAETEFGRLQSIAVPTETMRAYCVESFKN